MSGIWEFTKGLGLKMYEGGATSLTSKFDTELTYGIKTDFTAGVKSDYGVGMFTDIKLGGKFEASLTAAAKWSKEYSCEIAPSAENHYEDYFLVAVGASDDERLRYTRLVRATQIIMWVELLTMAAFTGAAFLNPRDEDSKSDEDSDDKDKEDSGDENKVKLQGEPPSGDPKSPPDDSKPGADEENGEGPVENEIAHSASKTIGLISNIMAVANALLPIVAISTNKAIEERRSGSPPSVISMDDRNGVFLGRRGTGVGTTSAEVLLNDSLVRISASDTDLRYDKPNGSSTIIGFQNAAGSNGTSGSRLEVRNTGCVGVYGNSFLVDLQSTGGTSTVFTRGQQYFLNVTNANGSAAGPALNMTETASELKFDSQNTVVVKKNDVSALAGGNGGSVMRLTDSSSSIGTGGNNITINAQGVTLTFGNQSLTINATGFTFGALSVLQPAAPSLSFAALQGAVAGVTQLQTQTATLQQKANVADTRFNAAFKKLRLTNKALIAAREQINALSQKVNAT